MASAVRSTALRAGGACVRCRKGKTKCVYENGRAPCKNCAKGLHECYLPSESMSHGGHGVSPARVQQRSRESLPSERTVSGTAGERQGPPASSVSRHVSSTTEKYVFGISILAARSLFFPSAKSGRTFLFYSPSHHCLLLVPSLRFPSSASFLAKMSHYRWGFGCCWMRACRWPPRMPFPGALLHPPNLHILALPPRSSSQAPFLRPASLP